MGSFTEEQRKRLIGKLRYNILERVKKLRFEEQALLENLSSKIKARLNLVPKKYWNLKIKDILELERNEKVTFLTLLEELKKKDPAQARTSTAAYESYMRRASRASSVSPRKTHRATAKSMASASQIRGRIQEEASTTKGKLGKISSQRTYFRSPTKRNISSMKR